MPQKMKPRIGAKVNTAHQLSRGLVGYWLFNEGGGNKVWDIFGKRHNGTMTNMDSSVAWGAAPGGMCLKLDGTNDYVDCGSGLSNRLQTAYSVWARVCFTSDAGIQPIVSLNVSGSSANGPINLAARYGTLVFRVNDSAFGYEEATVSSFAINTWYDIVGVRSGNNLRLYVNTVPGTDSTTAIPTFGSVTQQLRFGNNAYESTTYLNGRIDRVVIWERALTNEDIFLLSYARDINLLTGAREWIAVLLDSGSDVDVATAAGSLTLGGLIPTILNPRTVAVGLGSATLTGFVSQLLSSIATAAGAAVLSGQAPTAVSPYMVPVNVGSLVASGQVPTAITPYSLTTGLGQMTASGNASSLASTLRISAGSLTLGGQAPTASAPYVIATPAGSLTLGGFSPTLDVSADRTVETDVGSLTATGQAPTLLTVIPISAASATLSGHAPASTVSFVIPTAPGGLSLAGASPTLLHSIAVGLGQMLLSGQAPSAVNPVTLSIGAGAVTLTAASPTLDVSADLSVAVGSASLVLAGAAPAIGAPQVIAILPAAMLLSGQIPGVDLSNILAVVIQMRPADNVTTSARNELQSNLVRMRHNLEVQ